MNTLWFIFLLTFLLRLIGLNQSLWLDEATTARIVQMFNFSDIVQKFSLTDFHPPLYYFFMKSWTTLWGYSEISLRFPSILFSLLAGWFVYLIGKEMKDRKAGMWAAAFFLFNPLIIYYSQEARMYMMITLLLTGALYFLLKLTGGGVLGTPTAHGESIRSEHWWGKNSDRTRQFIWCNVFLFLSLLTFYGSIFFIIALYLYLLLKKQFKLAISLLPGPILSLLLLSPLLYQQFVHSQVALQAVSNWSLVLGKANIKNLLLIPLKFSIGRISFEPKVLYYAISGFWTLVVFYFAAQGARNKKTHIFSFLFLVPLVLGFLISFTTPLLQYFRFIYLIPLLSLLVAAGTKGKVSRSLLFFGFTIFSLAYLLLPQFHREDWKSLAKSLPAGSRIHMIPSTSDPLLYYRKDLKIADIRDKKQEKNLIIFPYALEIYGYDYRKELMKQKYRLIEEKVFREIKYEKWSL